MAPVLRGKDPGVILCIRAIVNFALLAQYASHDEDTIRYIEHYLDIFNRAKEALRPYRKGGYFAFPKIYILIYYMHHIRK